MNSFKIGCFYTPNTIYQNLYEECLGADCKTYGIDCIVYESKNYKDWWRNVAEKPKAIKWMLENVIQNDEVLAFVDVDTQLFMYPYLFQAIPLEIEIGYHTLNWEKWYGTITNPPRHELLTGTMVLRNTPQVLALCDEWYEKAQNTKVWEQAILESIIHKYNLKTYHLPLEYCYILTMPDGSLPKIPFTKDVVIGHMQASRDVKKRRIKL